MGFMADIFLSYAREDVVRVADLHAELTRLGWTVWWDDRIRAAAEFDAVIERALDTSSCVIVVWSRSSIASGWVRAEASTASDQGKLVPVRFEADVIPPLRFRQLNVVTLRPGPLTPPTVETLRLLAEITRLTGQAPNGIDPGLLSRTDGRVSGARTVTAGKWNLRIKSLRLPGKYRLELRPSGLVSGKAHWVFGDVAGRWTYDAARQVLQLEMSWAASDGIQVIQIEIREWLDDNTAVGRFEGRKAYLERIGG